MSDNMADRDGFIWFDGKLLPWREAKTHVLTHALHYGSAVFEGERIYDGRVFRLSAHSARLRNSARVLDYEVPWTREEIDAATRAVVKANNLQSGYIRPIAWRGSEVMGVSGDRHDGASRHRAMGAGGPAVGAGEAGRHQRHHGEVPPAVRPTWRRATPRWRASTSSAASRRIAR